MSWMEVNELYHLAGRARCSAAGSLLEGGIIIMGAITVSFGLARFAPESAGSGRPRSA